MSSTFLPRFKTDVMGKHWPPNILDNNKRDSRFWYLEAIQKNGEGGSLLPKRVSFYITDVYVQNVDNMKGSEWKIWLIAVLKPTWETLDWSVIHPGRLCINRTCTKKSCTSLIKSSKIFSTWKQADYTLLIIGARIVSSICNSMISQLHSLYTRVSHRLKNGPLWRACETY
jgi:hypothetical protein